MLINMGFFFVLNVIFFDNMISAYSAGHTPGRILNPSVSFKAFPGRNRAADVTAGRLNFNAFP